MIERGHNSSDGIFLRIEKIIAEREDFIRRINQDDLPEWQVAEPELATFVLLGRAEWDELVTLCQRWGYVWPRDGASYNPEVNELSRAQFRGRRCYRVDCASFLAAL